MKKQVYLFDETSRGAAYGIGTYIQQMKTCLTDISDLALHVVHIGADVEDFEIKQMQGYDLYNIPQYCIPMGGQKNTYQRGICYLIRLNCDCSDSDKLIFVFNYFHHFSLISLLKQSYPYSYMYFVVHYQDWCFGLSGDVERLRRMIHSNDILALPSSEQVLYNSFLLEKELFKMVNKVICLSGFTLSLLNEEYGMPRNKLMLIYNGLKDERKRLTVEERNQLKKQYNFSSKEKTILFVGRLDVMKGVEVLIRSFQELLQRNKKYRLVIVGDGEFSSCLTWAGSSWNKITFTGRLNKDQLYDFYQIADIGVIPSMHEQCSYVAIEMMMFGLPLITSTRGGLKEMMQNGEFGYTFDLKSDSRESVKDLADLIMRVLDVSAWSRKKIQKLLRSSYEKKYSVQDMQKEYVHLMLGE